MNVVVPLQTAVCPPVLQEQDSEIVVDVPVTTELGPVLGEQATSDAIPSGAMHRRHTPFVFFMIPAALVAVARGHLAKARARAALDQTGTSHFAPGLIISDAAGIERCGEPFVADRPGRTALGTIRST